MAIVIDERGTKRNYEKLAAAIVLRAILDYQESVDYLWKTRHKRLTGDVKEARAKALTTIEEVEKFVQSDYFGVICPLSKEAVTKRLRAIKERKFVVGLRKKKNTKEKKEELK